MNSHYSETKDFLHTLLVVLDHAGVQSLWMNNVADFPNAYKLFENEVTLPLHTRLTDEDVEYVIGNYIDVLKKRVFG